MGQVANQDTGNAATREWLTFVPKKIWLTFIQIVADEYLYFYILALNQ